MAYAVRGELTDISCKSRCLLSLLNPLKPAGAGISEKKIDM